jgi:hypothetical protein
VGGQGVTGSVGQEMRDGIGEMAGGLVFSAAAAGIVMVGWPSEGACRYSTGRVSSGRFRGGAALGAWMVAVALVSLGLPVATLVVWRRQAALSAGHGSGRRRGKGGHGDGRGSGVALVSSSAVSPAAVSPAATVAPSPSTTEPAAAVVTAPVVPAVLAAAVAVATEEAVVARAGPHPGPAPPPAAITAAADKVCYDAKDYAYRDHEQDNQKQFHGTTLPVDARDARSYLTRMRPFVTTLSFLRAPARGSYTRPQTY